MSSIENIKQKLSKTAKGSFAVFDFDNTCIVNDIGEAVLMYLRKNMGGISILHKNTVWFYSCRGS